MKFESKKKQQGMISAVEVAIVLAVTVVATTGLAAMFNQYNQGVQADAVADHANIVLAAGTKYVQDNYAAISGIATATTPAVITPQMLRNTSYLPTSVSLTNNFGQSYQLLALEPTANKLQVLLVTVNGTALPENVLRRAAAKLGGKGGMISKVNANVATGSFGGWQISLSSYGVSPGAGHLAVAQFFDEGSLSTEYLHRKAVPGRPEANAMETAIDMRLNDLNNVGDINTVNVVASGSTDTRDETYTGGWFRARGDGMIHSEKWGGGWFMNDPNWVRSYNNKGIYTGGTMLAGTVKSEGRLTAGEYLKIEGVATEGAACSENGLAARKADGSPLYCQSGVWKGAGGMTIIAGGVCAPLLNGFWDGRADVWGGASCAEAFVHAVYLKHYVVCPTGSNKIITNAISANLLHSESALCVRT